MSAQSGAPRISVVIPTRNEAAFIGDCLENLRRLDYPEDRLDILVVDGRSSDGTPDIARRAGARVLTNPKQTEPAGRNLGALQAWGELIAFTDADCIVDGNWLKNSLKYFDDPRVAAVGGINLTPPSDGAFARAVGFAFSQPLLSPGTHYGRILDSVKRVPHLPWCNAIYRRSAMERALPIAEDLLFCADVELNHRLRLLGYELLYTPDAFVWHHRRATASKLWMQMHKFAIARLQLSRKHPELLHVAHVGAGLAIPAMVVGAGMLALAAPGALLLPATAGAGALLLFAALALRRERSVRVALSVPVVIGAMVLGWSSGFVRQLLFPLGNVTGR